MKINFSDEDRIGKITTSAYSTALIKLDQEDSLNKAINPFIFCHTSRPGVYDVYKLTKVQKDIVHAISVGVFYRRMGEYRNILKMGEKTSGESGAYAFLWDRPAKIGYEQLTSPTATI